MGAEVASRPPLPPGLNAGSNLLGLGPGRRKNERERSFSSSGSVSSVTVPNRVYSRDYQLQIQGRKYGLSTSFVCIGAKIHNRISPSSYEGQKDQNAQVEQQSNYQEYQSEDVVPRQAQNQNLQIRRKKHKITQEVKKGSLALSPDSFLDLEVSDINYGKSNSVDLTFGKSSNNIDYAGYCHRYVLVNFVSF